MEDPLPENIDGSKRVVHTVNHNVNWSHVALAIVALVVLAKIGPVVSSRNDVDEAMDEEW